MFATDASEVLIKILIRSKVLRKAGAAEIAIVVKVINTAVALWAKPDPREYSFSLSSFRRCILKLVYLFVPLVVVRVPSLSVPFIIFCAALSVTKFCVVSWYLIVIQPSEVNCLCEGPD